MFNVNVVVEIKAPEIVEVIRALIGALVGVKPIEGAPVQIPSVIPPIQQPQYFPQMQEPQQAQPQLQQVQPQQMQLQQQEPVIPQQQAPVQQEPPQIPVQQMQPQQPQLPQQPMQQPLTAVPTTAASYTMDQLAVAATQLMDAGRKVELVALLTAFGVQALTMLPKEQYGNFATQLRTMGARI